MKDCKKTKKDFVAFLVGELNAGKKERLESHLDVCSLCQSELEELKEVLKKADSLNTEIESDMASIDWEALPEKISDYVFSKEASPVPQPQKKHPLRFLIQPRLRPVYAGLLLGVILGSFITFMVLRFSPFEERKGGKFFVSQDFLERVEFEMARRETINYLDGSQYLLLDFAQSSPEKAGEIWKGGYTSQRARDLLSKKKYINPQLNKFRMAKAKAICDQIEFLFYELAQISDELSAEEVSKLQNIIEEKQLLLKIKLLKKDLEGSEV